jgi:hypothetical protein
MLHKRIFMLFILFVFPVDVLPFIHKAAGIGTEPSTCIIINDFG